MFKAFIHFIGWWLCRSHSAALPEWLEEPLSHPATLPEWLEEPLSSHSGTQPLSGWSSHWQRKPEGVAFFVRVRRKRRLGKVLVFGDAGGLARVRALGLCGRLSGLLLVLLAHCSWQIGAQWRVESMCLKGCWSQNAAVGFYHRTRLLLIRWALRFWSSWELALCSLSRLGTNSYILTALGAAVHFTCSLFNPRCPT